MILSLKIITFLIKNQENFEKIPTFQKVWRLRRQNFGIFRNFSRQKVGTFLKKSLPLRPVTPPCCTLDFYTQLEFCRQGQISSRQ